MANKGWWWPEVETREGAEGAIKQAFWAAVVVAAITALFAVLGALGAGFARGLGIDAWAFADAALFAGIAFGLRRRSRVAAWAGLLLFGIEKVFLWNRNGVHGLWLAIIIFLLFIGGVRGTYALSRMEGAPLGSSQEPFAG
jgi:hypothetical protein